MSKIPAREFLRDEPSAKSSLDTILASPYTTFYEKPLRIMKIDSNGEESVEVTRTTFKTINDTVSFDKITEICENIITEKMTGKEKSLLSQLLFSLGEQVITIEQNLIGQIDLNIDNKVQSKHFDKLERELFIKLDQILVDRSRVSLEKMMDILENQFSTFQNKMDEQKDLLIKKFEDYFTKKIEENVNTAISKVNSHFENIIQQEVDRRYQSIHNQITNQIHQEIKRRIDESTQTDDERCNDGICELPETQMRIYDENSIIPPIPPTNEKVDEPISSIKKFEYIDENLLPDGSDMVFEDFTQENNQSKEDVEVVMINESKEIEVINESKEEIIINEPKEDIIIDESKEEIEVVNESKEEIEVVNESKEVEVINEPKEDIIIDESKEEIEVVNESKEVVVINEPKEDVEVVMINESKEVEVINEPKEDIIIDESKEVDIINESKEEVVNESKEIEVINESKEDIIINESKEVEIIINESKEIEVVNETNEV